MWPITTITERTSIQFPIIQAPMAGGATTPELVAAVSNAGGLGSLGAGYMQAPALKAAITRIRELTNKPFSVNLFIPEKHQAKASQINQMCHWVEAACPELKIKLSPVTPPYAPSFDEQMQVILEENVPVFSFTFGILTDEWIEKLKKKGIYLIGTATTLTEALLLEAKQIDAIVAQGSEAGGHRGTFIGSAEDALVSINLLLEELQKNIKIPVIAAGGIMDGKGIIRALTSGAQAVQMGTVFLSCHESGIHPRYKEALLKLTEDRTTLTRVFSGKMARGIRNKFIERMQAYQDNLLDYPVQNALTRPMRNDAEKKGNVEFMSMWAGQSAHLSKACSASELLNTLINDVNKKIE
ncbi:MAG: nitronate monooxygenase [Legionella sp.]|nr:nitronate monooxygenase [Legionella sp.]